jgi:type IV secretion system protein VirD4
MSRRSQFKRELNEIAAHYEIPIGLAITYVVLIAWVLPTILSVYVDDFAPLLVGVPVAERGTMISVALSYASVYAACALTLINRKDALRRTAFLATLWIGLLLWIYQPSVFYFQGGILSNKWDVLNYELSRLNRNNIFTGRAMNGATVMDGALMLVSACVLVMATRNYVQWWRKGISHRDIETPIGSAETAVLPDATWAPKARIKNRLRVKGGVVLGEDTNPLTESPDFQSFDRSTWGKQGKGDLIQVDPREGNGHTLVVSPSGSFKTSGILIPNIHEYDGPIFVVDPKCDLYDRCKDHREAMGRTVIKIDAEDGLDPLSLIFPLAQQYPTLYIAIANAICPPMGQTSANSEYFRNSATRLLTALMAYAVRSRQNDVPEFLMKLVNMPQKVFAGMAEQIPDDEEQKFIKAALLEVAQMDNKQYSGVKGEVFNNLQFLTMPDARQYITNSKNRKPITLTDLFHPNTDIFINVPDMIVEHHPAMIRLFFSTIVLAMRMLTQPDNPPARRLFMMDEAAMLKGMEVLKTLRNVGRGYGIHLMLIYQTIGQIEEIWGPHEFSSWFDTMHNKVIGSMENPDGSAKFSQMFGQHTVTTTTTSENRSRPDFQLFAGQSGETAQTQLKEVPLFAQHRLASLGPWGAIIKITGHPPILGTKAIYRTRPEMVKNIKSEQEIVDRRKPPQLGVEETDVVKQAEKQARDKAVFNLKPLQDKEERDILATLEDDPIAARKAVEESHLLTTEQKAKLGDRVEKIIKLREEKTESRQVDPSKGISDGDTESKPKGNDRNLPGNQTGKKDGEGDDPDGIGA